MNDIILREKLQRHGNAYLFQGGEHGGIPISFFWVQTASGHGPSLHSHPYAEVFVVQQGQATFTIGDATVAVRGGEIVIAPAQTPHKYKNSGDEPLHMIDMHASPQVITEWLEE